MPKSESYKPARCCHNADCDFLNEDPNQPCWGKVDQFSPGDDEDGWGLPGHLCEAHAERYDYGTESRRYIPEKTPREISCQTLKKYGNDSNQENLMKKTLCSTCNKYFASNTEFDAHRTGPYSPSARRCLSTQEMLDANWTHSPALITDETGRPMRNVWFRKDKRNERLEAMKGRRETTSTQTASTEHPSANLV